MNDLIRKDDALDLLCKFCGITEDVEKCRKTSADGWCKEYCELKNMPTVEAEPVRHGHWIEHPFSAVFEKVHSKDQIVCSCCEEAFNAFFNETERFKYCPNCGAKMDEVKDE